MTGPRPVLREALTRVLTTSAPGLPTADRLCQACVDLLDVDGAAITMVTGTLSQATYGASSDRSRRLDEYQYTFGEGPCLDAARSGRAVLVADLDSPTENRWPGYSDAVLREGVRAVFAFPIVLASASIGALDLFRRGAGPLTSEEVEGSRLVAELAGLPLLDLVAALGTGDTGEPGPLEALDRIEVHQATGMVIAQLDVPAAEALLRIRGHSIATGRSVSEVAWAIIERRLVLDADAPGDTSGGEVP